MDLDTYEYLVINSSTKLSKRFPDLRNEIDSVADEILKKIRSRRDEAEKKLEESGTKIGPIERKKKVEKFPPE